MSIIRDPDGVAVLTIGDDAFVGGYVRMPEYEEPPRSWARITTDAPRVDDDFEVARKRAKGRITLPIAIQGTSEADAKAKHQALTDAVEVDRWIWDVDGDETNQWVCDVADQDPPRISLDRTVRVVTLSIPAFSRSTV